MRLVLIAIFVCSLAAGCATNKIIARNCREIENAYFECEEP